MMDQDFYFNFEEKFRGSRENIIDRISIYDALIELIIKQNQENKFLDIGCGRGEWLQKWGHKVSTCVGIEVDTNMTNYCLKKGFKVHQGDAIETLAKFEKESISLITIFHTIEHLDNNYLNHLLTSCYRVLDEDGILIIETPSIDNIAVSTKSFYIDPTHINHIHPDGLSFLIEQKGFSKSEYYYINEGPLNNASASKFTKILNGIAQDIAFIITKSEVMSKLIFETETHWQKNFNNALSTIDAAIAYDLENEKIIYELNQKNYNLIQEVNASKAEILLLRNQLKYLIFLNKCMKKILSPFIGIVRKIKKYIMYFLNQIFKYSVKISFVREVLNSDKFLKIFNFILKKIFANSSNATLIKIKNNIDKFSKNDYRSNSFNNMLRVHHRNSKMSKIYFSLLDKGRDRKR